MINDKSFFIFIYITSCRVLISRSLGLVYFVSLTALYNSSAIFLSVPNSIRNNESLYLTLADFSFFVLIDKSPFILTFLLMATTRNYLRSSQKIGIYAFSVFQSVLPFHQDSSEVRLFLLYYLSRIFQLIIINYSNTCIFPHKEII